MRKLIFVMPLIIFSFLMLVGFGNTHTAYYRIVQVDGRLEISGTYEIPESEAKNVNCYQVIYDAQNRPLKLVYLKGGLPAEDDYFMVTAIKFSYSPGEQVWTFLNARGGPDYDQFDACGRKIVYGNDGFPLELFYLDPDGKPAEDSEEASHFKFSVNSAGLIVTETAYLSNGQQDYVFGPFFMQKYEYDSHGRLIKKIGLDKEGNVIPDPGQASIVEMAYDNNGNTTEVRQLNSDGSLFEDDEGVAITRWEYDKTGNQIKTSYYGTSSKLCDSPMGATVAKKYDEHGNLIEEAYFDHLGNPKPNPYGEVLTRWTYDAFGNCTLLVGIDQDGSYVADEEDGYAYSDRQFDSYRNVIQERFFDNEGRLAEIPAGYAVVRFRYDSKDNPIEESYYGKSGVLQLNSDGIAATRWQYDNRSQIISVSYYNLSGRLAENKSGIAAIRFRYTGEDITESCYYGQDNRLKVVDGLGYALIRKKYDSNHHVIEESYFGANGGPKAVASGCATIRRAFDSEGRNIWEGYYGVTGKPVVEKDSEAAAIRRVYDQDDNVIEEKYYGTDGMLTMGASGRPAVVRRRLDQDGNVVEESYYNAKDKLFQPKDTDYAMIRRVYGDDGNLAEEHFFDADALPKQEISTVRYKTDPIKGISEQSFYGPDDKLTENPETGAAKILVESNQQGQPRRIAFFGVDNQPKEVKSGMAAMEMDYTEDGQLLEARFFGANGSLKVRSDLGAAVIHWKYGQDGKLIKVITYDQDRNMIKEYSEYGQF